ncbi:MAG: glycosyltransferase family 1 protein [Patescibacteria group bacterium]|jgi:glycosyltransferase involved in cell wall biosynthesis
MKIGIDARFWGPEGKGLGRYTQKLIENLEKIDQTNQYRIFVKPSSYETYQPKNPNFIKVLAPYRWYSVEEQLKFPALINAQKLDLVHFPHFNVPLLYRRPYLVTIHDLIITHFPTTRATTLGPVKYFFKRLGYQWVIATAVKRSRKVITVSDFVKNELVKFFKLPETKVAVTYEATDLFQGEATDPDTVLAQYHISRPYLLYVGNAYPHKNLEMLVAAFKELRQRHADVKLVLVGKMDYFYQRLKKMSDDMGLGGAVIYPGYVPDEHLPALYQKALLYVFPSLSEGFGLPPLEAMQYGVPVAAAHSSCLPEILGNGVVYFNPNEKHDIVNVLANLIEQPDKRDELVRLGNERVRHFSWETMARQTVDLYQSMSR